MLPDELKSRYSSSLPFHPDHLCYGWDSPIRYLSERKFLHAMMRANAALISQAQQYLSSFESTRSPTLLHYRDKLLYKALSIALQNVQFVDPTQTQLTSHASKLWDAVPFERVWEHIPFKANASEYSFRFSAPLGSLAFYMKDLDLEGLYPLECIGKLLSYCWALLGLPLDQYSPSQRHRLLLGQLRVPIDELLQVRDAVGYLLSDTVSSTDRPYRQELRRWLIGPNDSRNLPMRLITQEYSGQMIDIVYRYLSLSRTRLQSSIAIIHSVLPPIGMVGVYQLFILESYYLASKYLTDLPAEQLTLPYQLAVSGQSEEISLSLGEDLAKSFALGRDAALVLSMFNSTKASTVQAADLLNETLYWMIASGIHTIPVEDDRRLLLEEYMR